jgi:hypothetical protein
MTEPAGPWGRVEADGTVYVRTSDGERPVGSFQAGSPDQALAYYQRKFAALELEVGLLERRITLPEVSPDESAATLNRLREALASPAAVGDLDGLRARLENLSPVLSARRDQERAGREKAKAEAREHRERIVTEAESLAESTQWKRSGDRLRELLDEWKSAPHVDRTTEQALWRRFGAARNTFDRRRRQHFAQLSAEQATARDVKAKLVAEAEELATSTDWGPTATRLRTLMDQWKAAARAGKADEDRLWHAFRAAQDAFFASRSAAFGERDATMSQNAAAKEAIAAEAEALLPITDAAAARTALRSIRERWEAAGTVSRTDRDRLDGRLRKVEDAVRTAEEGRWKRTNPEGRARAQAAVDQLNATIAKLEGTLAAAESTGDAKAITSARESLEARREWLVQAQAALAEFTAD